MESNATLYEKNLEYSNETLSRKLEETERILDNINETQEEKERKYQEIIRESLDTIYQLASALHNYKTMVDQNGDEPNRKELEMIGKHYLKNFMKYSLTHEATVSTECEDMVEDFIEKIKENNNYLEKIPA